LAILTRTDLKGKIKVCEDEIETEVESLWIQIDTPKKPTTIGVFYGPQENSTRENTQRQYEILKTQILTHQQTSDTILTGDFNAKLAINTTNLKQNQSPNGKLLQNLIKTLSLNPINLESKTGLWTRVNRNKPSEKSIIDYILIPNKITLNIHNIQTLENSHLANDKTNKKSDHNIMTITLKTTIPIKPQTKTVWKQADTVKWQQFNTSFQNNYKQSNNETYDNLQKCIIKSLNETIGKKTITLNKTLKPTNPQIKKARGERKIKKKKLNTAIKSKDPTLETK
jgi:hypothetical protein